jgi:hypothetical protein
MKQGGRQFANHTISLIVLARRVTWVNNTINFISQRLVKHWLTVLAWLAIALLGAGAVGGIALNRGESINSFWFIAAAVCIYALGCN